MPSYAPGSRVTSLGLASFLLVLDQDVTWLVAIPTFAVAGFGMGLAYSPLALIVLREAAADVQGAATSALSLLDSVGTALGTGLTGALVAASIRSTGEPGTGLAVAFALAVVVGLGGVVLSSRLRPRTVAVAGIPRPAAATPAGPVADAASVTGSPGRSRSCRARCLR